MDGGNKMDIWFDEKIVKEKEKTYILKGISYKAFVYETDNGKTGIRVPLTGNGELFSKFSKWAKNLKFPTKGVAYKKAQEYGIIPYCLISKEDEDQTKVFPIMGFYILNDYVIFTDPNKSTEIEFRKEPNAKVRLNRFINYYGKKYNLFKD